jgi:hypothetical protein
MRKFECLYVINRVQVIVKFDTGHKQLLWSSANCKNAGYSVFMTMRIMKCKFRYSEKHIGLGTKRYIDSLGGC